MLPRFIPALLSCAAALSSTESVTAVTYFVAPCGQNSWMGLQVNCVAPLGPKRTIQAAIAVANDGDTINVLPGTYFETLDLDGKAITIIGLGGPANTIIDSNGAAPVVTCNSGEGPDTVLQGLKFTGADTTADGGAMLNALSSPTIIDCIFSGNYTEGNGAAMANFAASPTIIDCIIAFNQAGAEPPGANNGRGGAIYSVGGHLTIANTFFQTCYATDAGGVIALVNNATATLTDCDIFTSGGTFQYGDGGAIFADNSDVDAENCHFQGIHSQDGGALLAVNGSDVSFSACDFMSCGAMTGGAASVRGSDASFLGCTFDNNAAHFSGGAVHVEAGSLSAILCGFTDNRTNQDDGAAMNLLNAQADVGLCTFMDNSAQYNGGAIASLDSVLIAEGCALSGNTAANVGGGVHFEGDKGHTTLASCTFANNTAVSGGGVRGHQSSALIADCEFEGNHASLVGGGLCSGTADVTARGSTFVGNTSDGSGGGFAGGGLLVGCEFTGNSAPQGAGAITVGNLAVTFVSCRFHDNTALDTGAAIVVALGATARVVNGVVYGNTAGDGRGALAELPLGTLHIANSTVANNFGGGVYISESTSPAIVANSIIWGNFNGGQFPGFVPTVRYSNVQGGAAGAGNLNQNPLFLGALGGNYRLNPASPCIDAGNNWALPPDVGDLDADTNTAELTSLDFDGNPRIADALASLNSGCGVNAVVDIGPFETAGTPIQGVRLGDVDGDGVVDIDDLLAVIAAWGPCPGACCASDFDVDGDTDIDDLLTLISNWG